MNFGLTAIVFLLATWMVVRTRRGDEQGQQLPWSSGVRSWQLAAGAALILAANYPLFTVTWPFSSLPALAPSDSHSHAMIAQAIAKRGIPHGWIDIYQGGFPVGPHYPVVGWLLIAALVKLGAPPAHAALAIGTSFLLAVPLLACAMALRVKSRLAPAILAAAALSWISPANGFVGGYEAYWGKGLISQIVCMPFVVGLVFLVASPSPAWAISLVAALAMASHPQITVACLIAMMVPVLVSWDSGTMRRYARAVIVAGAVGAAVFGPGVLTLEIPFGWPPMADYLVTGYSFERVRDWVVEGDLLDLDRAPVLTAVWGGSLLVAAVRIHRPAARAVLAGSLAMSLLVASGGLLAKLGTPGQFLLGFVQPLRFVALVPIALAASVLVAAEEASPFVLLLIRRATGEGRWTRWGGRVSFGVGAAAVLGLAAGAMPSRVEWAREVMKTAEPGEPGSARCAPHQGEEEIRAVLQKLEWGRLWYDEGIERGAGICALDRGSEFHSGVPVAPANAAGAHVGVHTAVFGRLDLHREGCAHRAEALGIRYALLNASASIEDRDKWKVIAETGAVRVFERLGGTDTIGVGCVESVWEGTEAALRGKVFQGAKESGGADSLLNPRRLVELRASGGEVRESPTERKGCDAEAAMVREKRREPGAYEAEVEAGAPVDVVIRATAFPSWRVKVNGEEVPVRRVGAGFFSVRVAAGRHQVTATVGPPKLYGAGLTFALFMCIAASLPWGLLCRRMYEQSSSPRRICR